MCLLMMVRMCITCVFACVVCMVTYWFSVRAGVVNSVVHTVTMTVRGVSVVVCMVNIIGHSVSVIGHRVNSAGCGGGKGVGVYELAGWHVPTLGEGEVVMPEFL